MAGMSRAAAPVPTKRQLGERRVGCPAVQAKLYGIPASHPSLAAELMLRRKGIEYRRVDFPHWFHKAILRGLRFPGTTVPALVLDGRRVQTTRAIARALDAERPDPPLVPADPELRREAEAAEAWADEVLQEVGRRLVYWGLQRDRRAIDSYFVGARLVLPYGLLKPAGPVMVRVIARGLGATDVAVQADLAELPSMFDRIEAWIDAGVIGGKEPNVADYQIATALALILAHDDIRAAVADRPVAGLVQRVAPGYPGRTPPVFPAAWLAPLAR
jgi:glutathione S-transferase